MFSAYVYTLASLIGWNAVSAQYLPDATANTVRELEHIYLDASPNGLINGVTPCSTYIDPSTGQNDGTKGRQTASEWIRVAFHDFVTANIYTQSGGLDASIGFEVARDENIGTAFVDALTNFSYFFSKMVSMADLIALGVSMSSKQCGGPIVPFRAGRTDATAAGPSGVPKPETNLQDTLNQFANAGFVTGDTIILTACGHSLGGVHKKDFPEVIPVNSTCQTEGADGRCNFDSTPNGFDVASVSDYVQSTGLKGGPLVTTPDVTRRSDLRLFQADQNQTVERLSQSQTYFSDQCQGVFRRMIETVPGSTRLISPAIDPSSTTNLKPYNVLLSLDYKGTMTLTGSFRYVQAAGAGAAPGSLTIALINRSGKTTKTTTTAQSSAQDTGTGVFGATRSYAFTLSFDAKFGMSGLTANGATFPLQDTMFVVPAMSSINPQPPPFSTTPAMDAATTYTFNTTVAYLSNNPPASLAVTFNIPSPQQGTISPKIDSSTTATLELVGKANGYASYSALTSKSISAKSGYGTSLDVGVAGQSPGVLGFKPFGA